MRDKKFWLLIVGITLIWGPPSDVLCHRWRPSTGMSWQIQLGNNNFTGIISQYSQLVIVDVDMGDQFQAQAESAGLLRSTYKLICYFSVGTYEPWRAAADKARGLDWKKLEASVGGANNLFAGKLRPPFQEETWLLIKTKKVRDALVAFMAGRLDAAWRTGCDGVDMDNVDAYDNVKPAGMIKVAHELDYVGALVAGAQTRGLAVGLKNALDLLPHNLPDGRAVVDVMDWYVNERCAAFSECGAYQDAGVPATVPVWNIEYCDARKAFGANNRNVHPDCFCNVAAKDPRFSVLIKDVALTKVGTSCAIYCAIPTASCRAPPKNCFFTSPQNACKNYGVV